MSYYSVLLRKIKCISTESGVDAATISSLSSVASKYFEGVSEVLGQVKDPKAQALAGIAKIESKIAEEVPGLASAIDHDRNDPDELYIARDNDPGTAIWPKYGKASKNHYDIRSGGIWVGRSSLNVFSHIKKGDSAVYSLWEYDVGSRDDFLGSFEVSTKEIGHTIAKIVVGHVEKSIYLLEYEVHEEKEQYTDLGKSFLPAARLNKAWEAVMNKF